MAKKSIKHTNMYPIHQEGQKTAFMCTIDPGHKTGYAIFEDGRLERSGVVTIESVYDIKKFLYSQFDKYDRVMLAIENQYMHFNTATYKRLVKIAFSWEYIFATEMINFRGLYRVNPSRWQKWIGIKKERREQRKKKSVQYAKKHANTLVIDNNQADAINIGLYVLNNYEKIPVMTKKEVLSWK